METRASYLIVGSFVLVLIAAAFAFVIWLAKIQLNETYTLYNIDFHGSVTGLDEGGVVRYRGISVGSVERIRIDPESVEEIQVTIKVTANTPVREDTVASLESQGLTGVAYVQLAGGTQASPQLKPKEGRKIAVIKSRASSLERVFNSAPELVDQANLLIVRASRALSDENLDSFRDTLKSVGTLTAAFAAKSDKIERALDDGSAAIHDLRAASASLDVLVKNLNNKTNELGAQLTPTIKELRQSVQSIDRLATEVQAVVSENRRPLKDFSSEGLYELTQFLTEARGMVEALTRLSNKIEADPARFFLGDQQQGVPAR
ncbi:MAG: MlaD family protein [Alphaproteobacteria bacterium]